MPMWKNRIALRLELCVLVRGSCDCIVEIIRRKTVSIEHKPNMIIGGIVASVSQFDFFSCTFDNSQRIVLRTDNHNSVAHSAG